MKIINSININGVNTPEREFPKDAISIVFDGEKYVIYERGDTVPEFNYDISGSGIAEGDVMSEIGEQLSQESLDKLNAYIEQLKNQL